MDPNFPTADAGIEVLEKLGVATEMIGRKKKRSYAGCKDTVREFLRTTAAQR